MATTRREILCAAGILFPAALLRARSEEMTPLGSDLLLPARLTRLREDRTRLSGLESEYKGKVRGRNLDATTEENKKIVGSLGFQSHGLVIRSAAGKVLRKEPDREVKIEDMRRKLDRLLAR